jgi:hypothetical protein
MVKRHREKSKGDGLLLSKWWRSPSAKAAFRRVEKQKKEKSAKVREYFRARKQAMQDAVNNWKVVDV